MQKKARTSKHSRIATASVTAALALSLTILSSGLMGTSAVAADGDLERGYPAMAEEWYFTAPPVTHPSGPIIGLIDESQAENGIQAIYSSPDSGGPSRGQGDIELSYQPPYKSAPSDEVTIDFASFEQMPGHLGTMFIDAILPNATAEDPAIYFYDSELTITRSAMPTNCTLFDPSQFEFQFALLGDNGLKYLVDADIEFGPRATKCGANKEVAAKPAKEPKPAESKPAESETPAPEESAAPAEEDATADNAERTIEEDLQSVDWFPIFVAGALLVGVFVFISVVANRKRRERFNADGSVAGDLHERSAGSTKQTTLEDLFGSKTGKGEE